MIFKSLSGKKALWQRREPPYFKVKGSKGIPSALLLEVYYQPAMWDIPTYCRKKPKQTSVWGISNSFLRCTGFTHIYRNKNMRKHMLLPETVSDQTVLGHQPVSCPACHSLVFWNLRRAPGLLCSPTAGASVPILHGVEHVGHGPAALRAIPFASHPTNVTLSYLAKHSDHFPWNQS